MPFWRLSVQAVILVGGEGTRLRPLTFGTPKPMVPIVGVPFLARTLERLYEAGIRDVILPAGYMPQAITEYFGDGSRLDMKITYVIEDEPLGTAGAIKNVEQHITGPFFMMNGDVLTSLDLRAMIAYHKEKGGLGVLHLIKVEDPSSFGCVVHDEAGRISQFIEKPPKGTEPTNEINAGTYLLDPDVLKFIPPGRNVSIERETFPKILAEGQPLYAYTTEDYWIDVGRPEHYLTVHRDILNGTMPLRVETGTEGSVHIGEGSRVDASAKLGPNVVLGKKCSIGAKASIKNSVLWDDVVIEEGALIEETIIASRSIIGANAKIGKGSVIGHDGRIEADTIVPEGSRIGPSAPIGAR